MQSDIKGFRLDSLEAHFGRTIKTGEFENCRADLKIGGVLTKDGSIKEIAPILFTELQEQITNQLEKVTNGFRDANPESNKGNPTEPGEPNGNPSNNGKTATLKQYKCIWAIAKNQGLDSNEIYQLMGEKLGAIKQQDVVGKIDRGLMSDFIKELQMATV